MWYDSFAVSNKRLFFSRTHWNDFKDEPVQDIARGHTKLYLTLTRLSKAIVMLLLFSVFLIGLLIDKSIILFLTSQLRSNTTLYCKTYLNNVTNEKTYNKN